MLNIFFYIKKKMEIPSNINFQFVIIDLDQDSLLDHQKILQTIPRVWKYSDVISGTNKIFIPITNINKISKDHFTNRAFEIYYDIYHKKYNNYTLIHDPIKNYCVLQIHNIFYLNEDNIYDILHCDNTNHNVLINNYEINNNIQELYEFNITSDTCVICLNKAPTIRFKRCLHTVLCNECYDSFITHDNKKCPYCRAPIF